MQPTLYGITTIDLNKIEPDQLRATADNGYLTVNKGFFSKNDTGRSIVLENGNTTVITRVDSPTKVKIDIQTNIINFFIIPP